MSRNVKGCRTCYHDVMNLPVASMPQVGICIYGFSCKSLSSENMSRRTLADVDAGDRLCSSGNTLAGCLTYVRTGRPRIIIVENVLGLLTSSEALKASGNRRNVDVLIAALRKEGYACGFHVLSSHQYLLPQRRWRVYVWGELWSGHGAKPAKAWSRLIGGMRSRAYLPLESFLNPGS